MRYNELMVTPNAGSSREPGSEGSAPPAKRPPIRYSPEIAAEICTRLAAGETLRQICRDHHMPAASSVVEWQERNAEFAERYARARREGLDAIADETMEIADSLDEDPNSRRVRVDARKWLLSKLRPDKYGDRVTLAGDDKAPLQASVTLRLVDGPPRE